MDRILDIIPFRIRPDPPLVIDHTTPGFVFYLGAAIFAELENLIIGRR